MRTVICPGSFDPITLGHIDIIMRAADLFEKVLVLVCNNSLKTYLFDVEKRLEFCNKVFKDNENIEIVKCDSLIIDYYKKYNATAIVKGVRNSTDYQYETELAGINAMMGGNVETLFLPARKEFICLSSNVVREFGKYGGDVAKIVPPCIANEIKAKFK